MTYYHVRHANGVTFDWLTDKWKAHALALARGLQLFSVNSISGRSVRIV